MVLIGIDPYPCMFHILWLKSMRRILVQFPQFLGDDPPGCEQRPPHNSPPAVDPMLLRENSVDEHIEKNALLITY